jgi:hypothetical protein
VATGDWRDYAACADRPDLDWFDIDCNLQACLQVCSTCPVADPCLAYAVKHQLTDGLWGGEWGYRLLQYVKAGRGRGRRG